MLTRIILENEEYYVLYTPIKNKEHVKFYTPLLISLWEIITKDEKKDMIIKCNLKKIINFDRVLQLFKYDKQDTLNLYKLLNQHKHINEIADEINKYFGNYIFDLKHDTGFRCICGVYLVNLNVVQHIQTKKYFVIGSECIHWWKNDTYNRDVRNTQLILNAVKNKMEIPKFCSFCHSNRNCINCKDKKFVRNIFQKWKIHSKLKVEEALTNLNSVVRFGKYNGKRYIDLCKDVSYCNFIMKNQFNDSIKKKIYKYIKYQKIMNKYFSI